MSFSSSVFSSDCKVMLKATDFLSLGIFSPSYTSKVFTSFIKDVSISLISFSSSPILKILSITNAKSLSDF